MSVQTADETKICLDDIRTKLAAIEDKTLSLDILDNLAKLENQLADKTAIIAKMTLRETELLTQNNQLFSRVTAITDKTPPTPGVDYSDIDRELNAIIDDI